MQESASAMESCRDADWKYHLRCFRDLIDRHKDTLVAFKEYKNCFEVSSTLRVLSEVVKM